MPTPIMNTIRAMMKKEPNETNLINSDKSLLLVTITSTTKISRVTYAGEN